MRVGFLAFVYVPVPDPPLKEQKQNTNTKQKKEVTQQCNITKQIAFQQFGK